MRISDIQIRDPFVVLEDNRYYLFGSTDKDIWKGSGIGFDVYISEGDLTPNSARIYPFQALFLPNSL
jgi:hypothetical protein